MAPHTDTPESPETGHAPAAGAGDAGTERPAPHDSAPRGPAAAAAPKRFAWPFAPADADAADDEGCDASPA